MSEGKVNNECDCKNGCNCGDDCKCVDCKCTENDSCECVKKVNKVNKVNKSNLSDEERHDELVENISNEALNLVKEWSNDKFGSYEEWFDLGSAIKKMVDEKKNLHQIDKIVLSLDVLHNVARKVKDLHEDKLDDKAKEVIEYFISDSHNDIITSVLKIVKKILNDADTNNDGKVSKEECNAWCKKTFCCIPSINDINNIDEIDEDDL
jgi:hypothetical protein